MLILWKWDELKKKSVSHDIVPVSNSFDDILIRISDTQKDQPAQMARNIQKIALNHLGNDKNVELLLLVHRSALGKEFHNGLLSDWLQSKVVSFGGGDNYLYYKYETDTGLVNQTGNLVYGDLYMKHIIKDGKRRPQRKSASVLVKDDSGNKSIIPKYFNQVWDYYTYECKKLIYEFKEELYIRFAGIEAGEEMPLEELLDGKEGLKHRLEHLCSPALSEKISVIYKENQEVITKFNELAQFLATENWSSNYLKRAREKFTHVLNAMPEKIY